MAKKKIVFEEKDNLEYEEHSSENHIYQMRDATLAEADAKDKMEEIEEEFTESAVAKEWGEPLNSFLEEKLGHLFYFNSPPVQLVSQFGFSLDVHKPVRSTTSMYAVKNLIEAISFYIQHNLGPIPDTWVIRDREYFMPTQDIIRLKLKTYAPMMEPTEEQSKAWKIKSTLAPKMNGEDETSFATAPSVYEDPGICYFLYGGLRDTLMTGINATYGSMMQYALGKPEKIDRKDAKAFGRILRRRFPNYSGALLEMGWQYHQIPLSIDDLPEDMVKAYRRAEIMEHQQMKEQMYSIAKLTQNVSQMASIIKSLDEESLLKKDSAKTRKASKGLGLKNSRPTWTK